MAGNRTASRVRITSPLALHGDLRLVFRAPSAHAIDDQADYQDQTNATAADDRSAKVKAAAAEYEKQYE